MKKYIKLAAHYLQKHHFKVLLLIIRFFNNYLLTYMKRETLIFKDIEWKKLNTNHIINIHSQEYIIF